MSRLAWLMALPAVLITMSIAQAQPLRLPFEGRWFVGQGGDTANVNHHMALRPQWFGIDFVKVGGPSSRELGTPKATRVEDFYSWGQPVLAPHAGEVVSVVNDLPDNPLGVKDANNPAGNYVSIKIAADRFVFLAHFQRGSIVVKSGDRVARGQVLGKCGNSGNSDLPHIHLHIQDQAAFNSGLGQMPVFEGIDVELSGKPFENVTWPLTRGLFVSPR
jgi:Peptidase family M23